jgi:hypothetical protein
MAAGPSDLLLQQYISCLEDERAEEILEALLVQHALPSIQTIVRRRFSFQGAAETQDVEDIVSEVMIELIGRVRAVRAGSASGTIEGFPGYAAVAAYHGCHEYLRRKYPNRYRLKTRLRYLLNHERRFAIWEDAQGDWWCGLRSWRRVERPAQAAEPDDPRLATLPRGSATGPPAETVATVLERLGGPVELDRMVNIMAVLWDVTDAPAVPLDTAEVESGAPDAGRQIDLRRWAVQLWQQIRELPHSQRIALLLNLRSPSSNGPALILLLFTGVASFRELAETLGMEAQQLAAIWNRLPLDDLQIADYLGVTRQQVINARKSARERLIRRMGKPEGN